MISQLDNLKQTKLISTARYWQRIQVVVSIRTANSYKLKLNILVILFFFCQKLQEYVNKSQTTNLAQMNKSYIIIACMQLYINCISTYFHEHVDVLPPEGVGWLWCRGEEHLRVGREDR